MITITHSKENIPNCAKNKPLLAGFAFKIHDDDIIWWSFSLLLILLWDINWSADFVTLHRSIDAEPLCKRLVLFFLFHWTMWQFVCTFLLYFRRELILNISYTYGYIKKTSKMFNKVLEAILWYRCNYLDLQWRTLVWPWSDNHSYTT